MESIRKKVIKIGDGYNDFFEIPNPLHTKHVVLSLIEVNTNDYWPLPSDGIGVTADLISIDIGFAPAPNQFELVIIG